MQVEGSYFSLSIALALAIWVLTSNVQWDACWNRRRCPDKVFLYEALTKSLSVFTPSGLGVYDGASEWTLSPASSIRYRKFGRYAGLRSLASFVPARFTQMKFYFPIVCLSYFHVFQTAVAVSEATGGWQTVLSSSISPSHTASLTRTSLHHPQTPSSCVISSLLFGISDGRLSSSCRT